MKLTSEQINFLKEKISFYLKKNCQFCDHNNWVLSDTLFEIREFTGGNIIIDNNTSVMPLIVIICGNCGNMIFINAVSLKIFNKDE